MTNDEIRCPIKLPANENESSKRCFYHVADGFCPRHGNVIDYIKRYRKLKTLTEEAELPRKQSNKTIATRFIDFIEAILIRE